MKKILITKDQYKSLMKYIKQPDGISCGPTCIKMVADFYRGDIPTIKDICKMCGTDAITGTPPERMRKGLDGLNIKYIEHVNEENPYQSLRDSIDNGSVTMLRTLTHGVPHWIVVHSYQEENFFVNDPWLGQIEYTTNQLEKIWRERDFFFFEVLNDNRKKNLMEEVGDDVKIRPFMVEDFQEIFNMLSDVYSKLGNLSPRSIWSIIVGECGGDFKDSVVVTVNDEVAGFYFLNEDDLHEKGDITKDMVGIQGVALGVSSKFKNLGIGKMLINYPATLGYDYVWGYQLKKLENIDDWLKRRKIYSESGYMFTTYQIFNSNE
jgi:hypothetical protein